VAVLRGKTLEHGYNPVGMIQEKGKNGDMDKPQHSGLIMLKGTCESPCHLALPPPGCCMLARSWASHPHTNLQPMPPSQFQGLQFLQEG
jgi:hypothetical protein